MFLIPREEYTLHFRTSTLSKAFWCGVWVPHVRGFFDVVSVPVSYTLASQSGPGLPCSTWILSADQVCMPEADSTTDCSGINSLGAVSVWHGLHCSGHHLNTVQVAALEPGYLKQHPWKHFWSLTSSVGGKETSERCMCLLEATEANLWGFMKHLRCSGWHLSCGA